MNNFVIVYGLRFWNELHIYKIKLISISLFCNNIFNDLLTL